MVGYHNIKLLGRSLWSRAHEVLCAFMGWRIILLWVVLVQGSCTKATDRMVRDRLRINFYTTLPQTRSTDDYAIQQVDALVFTNRGSGYQLDYQVAGSTPQNSAGTTLFDLEVRTSSLPVKMIICANARSALLAAGLVQGDTESVVMGKVNFPFGPSAQPAVLPMWGEQLFLTGISSSATPQSIQLEVLRTLARIDLEATSVAADFELTTVRAYRVNTLSQLVPSSFSDHPLRVSAPSIPLGAAATLTTTPIAVSGNRLQGALYLPEAAAPLNLVQQGCCIVVGGKFKGAAESFYRADFTPVSGQSDPAGQILRNHLYTFRVDAVHDHGWPTPGEAANNYPTQMSVTVINWIDMSIEVGVGAINFFRIENLQPTLEGVAGSEFKLPVATSVIDYTLQWSDATGSAAVGTPAYSLDNANFWVTKGRGGLLITALGDNVSGSPLTEYVLAVAGRSQVLITLVQNSQ